MRLHEFPPVERSVIIGLRDIWHKDAGCCSRNMALAQSLSAAWESCGPRPHISTQQKLLCNAMKSLATQLRGGSRRQLGIARPFTLALTADELSILACLAAVNARDIYKARAHLRWLLAGASADLCLSAARTLIYVLARSGHNLPDQNGLLREGKDIGSARSTLPRLSCV